jgi:hypothetical protein
LLVGSVRDSRASKTILRFDGTLWHSDFSQERGRSRTSGDKK